MDHPLLGALRQFMTDHLYPLERDYREWTEANPWRVYPAMEELKARARAAGLWNLFLPPDYGAFSPGLSNR